jgi:ABC-type spermidine/putrescine transport system permease subunit II
LLPGEASLTIGVAAMVVAALIAVVYSYMAWRDEPTREGRRDA